MTKFIKISGNYGEVANKLGFAASEFAPSTLEQYTEQVAKDLGGRTPAIISFTHTATQVQQQLADTTNFPPERLQYAQGNFDGGAFTKNYLGLTAILLNAMDNFAAIGETTNDNMVDLIRDIRLAYVDQDEKGKDVYWGISITYLRLDPNVGKPFIPMDQRARPFVVTLIKNTNFAPADRDVTYLSHPKLLTNDAASQGVEVKRGVLAEIANVINSHSAQNASKILALLADVIQADTLSMKHFNALSARLKLGGVNLDDRDAKQVDVRQCINSTREKHPGNKALVNYLNGINERSLNDVNFFKDGDFESTGESVSRGIQLLIDIQELKDLLNVHQATQETSATTDVIKLFAQGQRVLENIEAIVGNDLSKLGPQSVCDLHDVLQCTLTTLRNPTHEDSANMQKLADLSQRVSGNSSLLWKALGAALMLFTAIAMVVAGVLGAIPTGGASLAWVVGGAALATSAGVMGMAIGCQSGLAKSVTFFKSAAEMVVTEAKLDEEAEALGFPR